MSRKVLKKIGRDLLVNALLLVLCGLAYVYLRYLDPSATVDGLGNLFVALQIIIIGTLCGLIASGMRWFYFRPPPWAEVEKLATDGGSWQRVAMAFLDRLTWFAIFLLFFYFASGR